MQTQDPGKASSTDVGHTENPNVCPITVESSVSPPPSANDFFQYCQWRSKIERLAKNKGYADFFRFNLTKPMESRDLAEYYKNYAAAKRLIFDMLSEPLLQLLGDDFGNLAPYLMMDRIRNLYRVEPSPAMHDLLQKEALRITFKDGGSLEEYIQKHIIHRYQMIRYKCPGCTPEATTVAYIIHGLHTHSYYRTRIIQLCAAEIKTVMECKASIARIPPQRELPRSVLKWCQIHGRFGNHSTPQCSALSSFGARKRKKRQLHNTPRE